MPPWIRDGPHCQNRTVLSESDRILVGFKGCAALLVKNRFERRYGRHYTGTPASRARHKTLGHPEAHNSTKPPRRDRAPLTQFGPRRFRSPKST
jgi:hypothetical protein